MSEQPQGEMRYRQATQLGVSFPERTIEVIAVPYEQETVVPHKGRMIREVFSRGAFDGIQRRANRVKIYREHDERGGARDVVGRALSLYPNREEGLVAELKISNTALGDETLTLASDGILDASVGYLPMPGGEKWLTRSSVRIEKGWLGHIALVPEPAYEGAKVLAVRAKADGELETPNLDKVREMILADRYAEFDRRL